jgi:cytochrome c-type biogenesis protein CcmE
MSTATEKRIRVAAPATEGVSWKFWVGLVVLMGATGYIVTSSMGSTVHYYDVHQVVGNDELVGGTMRLRGLVVDGSHRVREGTLDEHLFLLGLEQQTVTVLFKGALPDQFQDGASVIATGVLVDGQTFEADAITAQCPSRYENEAPTAAANREAMGADSATVVTPVMAPPPGRDQPAGPYLRRTEAGD